MKRIITGLDIFTISVLKSSVEMKNEKKRGWGAISIAFQISKNNNPAGNESCPVSALEE